MYTSCASALHSASLDVIVIHAVFADKALRTAATAELTDLLGSVSMHLTGPPTPLVGLRLWSFVGAHVVREEEGMAHCRVVTLPIRPGTLDYVLVTAARIQLETAHAHRE